MNMFLTETINGEGSLLSQFRTATKIARAMPDKLASKMVLEQGQILCSAHWVCGDGKIDQILYKLAHKNHPVCKWVRKTKSNYQFGYLLFLAQGREFYYRRGKHHGTYTRFKDILKTPPKYVPDGAFTEPPQCLSGREKNESYAIAYRDFIAYDKDYPAWNWGRPAPKWYIERINNEDRQYAV